MAKCFICGGKAGLWGKGYTDLGMMMKDNADKIVRGEKYQIKIPNGMNEKDRICGTCMENGKLQSEIIGGSESLRGSMPKDFESSQTTTTNPYVNPATSPPTNTPSRNTSTDSTNKNTSAAQLRALTQALHDQTKSQWDKNGVVQYKDDKLAILKRVVGQQVQFIVAASKLTEEGYRLMSIDEGITAQGSGFTGGASAYFYFQKMEYVR